MAADLVEDLCRPAAMGDTRAAFVDVRAGKLEMGYPGLVQALGRELGLSDERIAALRQASVV